MNPGKNAGGRGQDAAGRTAAMMTQVMQASTLSEKNHVCVELVACLATLEFPLLPSCH